MELSWKIELTYAQFDYLRTHILRVAAEYVGIEYDVTLLRNVPDTECLVRDELTCKRHPHSDDTTFHITLLARESSLIGSPYVIYITNSYDMYAAISRELNVGGDARQPND
jgi:hypothetical protein